MSEATPASTHKLRRTVDACPLFARLDEDAREKLCASARWLTYPKGRMIFRDGDPPPGIFVVAAGLVRVYKLAPNGKEHVLHLVGPSNTFAEAAAVGEFPCPAFAEAVEDAECVLVPYEDLHRLLSEDLRLSRQLLAGMAGWIRHLVGLLEDIVLRDAAGRVAQHLLERAEGSQAAARLPGLKKHLASHLNLTSETLSRTLRRLTEAGLIKSSGGQRLLVVDREGLERVAAGTFPKV